MAIQNLTVTPSANIDDFVSSFNEYYKADANDLATDLYYTLQDPSSPFYIGNICQIRSGVKSREILMNLTSSNILQRASSRTWNPKEGLEVDGRALVPSQYKIDLELVWAEIYKEYMQIFETAQRDRVAHESNPIPTLQEYFMMEIIKRAGSDLREAIFKGVYSSNPVHDGHLQWMNGFTKVIKDEITATNITPLTGAAVTSSSDVLPKVKKMYQNMGAGWRNSASAQILVATNVWDFATDTTMFTSNNAGSVFNPELAKYVLSKPLSFAPNVRLVHEPNLPTGGMVATVKENLVVGFDSTDLAGSLRTQANRRVVEVMGDGSACVQIRRVESGIDGAPIVVNEAMAV